MEIAATAASALLKLRRWGILDRTLCTHQSKESPFQVISSGDFTVPLSLLPCVCCGNPIEAGTTRERRMWLRSLPTQHSNAQQSKGRGRHGIMTPAHTFSVKYPMQGNNSTWEWGESVVAAQRIGGEVVQHQQVPGLVERNGNSFRWNFHDFTVGMIILRENCNYFLKISLFIGKINQFLSKLSPII